MLAQARKRYKLSSQVLVCSFIDVYIKPHDLQKLLYVYVITYLLGQSESTCSVLLENDLYYGPNVRRVPPLPAIRICRYSRYIIS